MSPPDRKPRDDEIDVHGLTHIGKVRKQNQDHFLLASIHKRVEVHRTSLPEPQHVTFGDQRVAFVAMVADGVGGGEGGAEASATALENAMEYLVSSMDCYYRSDSHEEDFINALQDAAPEESSRGARSRPGGGSGGQDGHDAHAVHGGVAVDLSPAGRRLALLPVARWHAHPGVATIKPSRRSSSTRACSRVRSPRGRSSPTCCRARSAASKRRRS